MKNLKKKGGDLFLDATQLEEKKSIKFVPHETKLLSAKTTKENRISSSQTQRKQKHNKQRKT